MYPGMRICLDCICDIWVVSAPSHTRTTVRNLSFVYFELINLRCMSMSMRGFLAGLAEAVSHLHLHLHLHQLHEEAGGWVLLAPVTGSCSMQPQ